MTNWPRYQREALENLRHPEWSGKQYALPVIAEKLRLYRLTLDEIREKAPELLADPIIAEMVEDERVMTEVVGNPQAVKARSHGPLFDEAA